MIIGLGQEFYSETIALSPKRADNWNLLGDLQVFDLRDLFDFGNSSYTDKLFPWETKEVNGKKIDIPEIHGKKHLAETFLLKNINSHINNL